MRFLLTSRTLRLLVKSGVVDADATIDLASQIMSRLVTAAQGLDTHLALQMLSEKERATPVMDLPGTVAEEPSSKKSKSSSAKKKATAKKPATKNSHQEGCHQEGSRRPPKRPRQRKPPPKRRRPRRPPQRKLQQRKLWPKNHPPRKRQRRPPRSQPRSNGLVEH